MSFNTSPGRAEYTAGAGQTIFPFSFKIFANTDLKVYQTPAGQDADDVNDLLTLTTDYTVTINGDLGGNITLVTPSAVNDGITLVRDLPIERPTEYQDNGDLLGSTLNQDQDYQTYLIADKDAANSRFVTVPESSQGISTSLPSPVGESYIVWSADGKSLTNDTTVPASVAITAANVVAAQLAQTNAETAETNAGNSATQAQLRAWEAEAEELSAQSNANEAVDVLTKTYTSDGDGTFTATPNAWYSAKHYASKAISGGTERTSARNTILSTAAAGALAQAVTPTPSFATVIYTGNGTSQNIVTGLKSYDPNWVSGRAYLLTNEQDAYCIHNYYIYKLLADVTSATTPDADPTKWEVVADGVSVPWLNSQVWIKHRSGTSNNVIIDTLRGAVATLIPNATNAEDTVTTTLLTSFNTDGLSVGSALAVNGSTATYVAWQEQFDTMVSGTTNQGKRYITASNAQSGKFMGIMVGSGTAGHEMPHGVGTKPDFLVVKNRDAIQSWLTYNSYDGATKYQKLDDNIASASSISAWNDTEATTSVFSLGTSIAVNQLDAGHVFYGSSNRANHTVTKRYQGTGAAGNVVPLGLDMTQAGTKFTLKSLSATGDWIMYDSVRGETQYLFANTSGAEAVADFGSFTSTGLILDSTSSNINGAGVTYLIEATVPNYDKPNGGLNRPAGNIYSFAEGVDTATGDKDAIEVTTSVDFSLTAGAKNYLFADKGNTVVASIYPMIKQIGKTLGTNSHIYDVETGTVLKYQELVNNGTFDTDTSGWTADSLNGVADAVLSVDANRLKVTNSGIDYGVATQAIPTEVGKTYSISVDYTIGDAGRYIFRVGSTLMGFNLLDASVGSGATSGTKSYEFTAVSSISYISIGNLNTSGAFSFWDNIRVGLVTGIPSSRIPLGEVVVDALGEAILDTLVVYPKTNDFVDVEVHGDAKFYGDISGKNICTAWVNFDGTTTPPTIRDSYNVSDVVRTATGIFEIYFTTAMDTTDYASCGQNPSQDIQLYGFTTGNTTAKVPILLRSDGGNVNYDSPLVQVQVFGGKV